MSSTNIYLTLIVILFLTSSCQKEDTFNTDLVPGNYTGSLSYFTSLSTGGIDVNVPDLSKYDGFKTTISKTGSKYTLSFDKSFKYTIPNITVEITSPMNSKIVAIQTTSNQVYSSSAALTSYPNYPPNYFSIDESVNRIDCNLTLISTTPDSIYYLHLALLRIY